jgi:hypothetical protein
MTLCKQAADVFFTASQVRQRYGGCSEMWLWRRLHDDASGFPLPTYINGRRFWRLGDLVAWEGSLAGSRRETENESLGGGERA